MVNRARFFIIACLLSLFVLPVWALNFESRYFKVEIDNNCDSQVIFEKLNVRPILQLDALIASPAETEAPLARLLDGLYLEVSDILDIHMHDFQVNLKF